jgi:hypothetical protein
MRHVNQPVSTILDELSPLARILAGVTCLWSLTDELLGATRPSDTVVMPKQDGPLLALPPELSQYFEANIEGQKRPQLRRSNPADAFAASHLKDIFERDGGELERKFKLIFQEGSDADNFMLSPFSFHTAFLKALSRPYATRPLLSEAIMSVNFTYIKDPRYRTRESFDLKKLNLATSNQKISQSNAEIIRRNFNALASSMERWISYVKKADPCLLGLPGITPSMGEAWLSRYAVIEQSSKNKINMSGLIQIVREARGAVTSDAQDTNLIVRDLLWIRSFTAEIGEHAVFDELYEKKPGHRHGSPIGFYYSVIDGKVYELKRILVRDGVVMIDALALFDDPSFSKSLSMHLPIFDDASLNFSMGSLMGSTTRQKRSGSWSVIAIRPSISHEESEKIDLALGIYADTLMDIDRSAYNKSITGLKEYLDDLRLGGVLSSDYLISSAPDSEKRKHFFAVETQAEFRRVFRTVKEHRENCINYRDRLFQRIFSIQDVNEQKAVLKDILLSLIEQQNSFAICPVSTTKVDLREFLQRSLPAEVVISFQTITHIGYGAQIQKRLYRKIRIASRGTESERLY